MIARALLVALLVVLVAHAVALAAGVSPAEAYPPVIGATVWVICAAFLLSAALHRAGPRHRR